MSKCGDCTLCCRLLKVPELSKPANQECVSCAVNKGCKIWKTRPQVCRDFECSYYQMDSAHEDLRPDNCKIIFEKISDNIFLGTQDPRHKMTIVAKKQINQFNKQGFSVVVAEPDKDLHTYLSPSHTVEQIKLEYKKTLEERYGSS